MENLTSQQILYVASPGEWKEPGNVTCELSHKPKFFYQEIKRTNLPFLKLNFTEFLSTVHLFIKTPGGSQFE